MCKKIASAGFAFTSHQRRWSLLMRTAGPAVVFHRLSCRIPYYFFPDEAQQRRKDFTAFKYLFPVAPVKCCCSVRPPRVSRLPSRWKSTNTFPSWHVLLQRCVQRLCTRRWQDWILHLKRELVENPASTDLFTLLQAPADDEGLKEEEMSATAEAAKGEEEKDKAEEVFHFMAMCSALADAISMSKISHHSWVCCWNTKRDVSCLFFGAGKSQEAKETQSLHASSEGNFSSSWLDKRPRGPWSAHS